MKAIHLVSLGSLVPAPWRTGDAPSYSEEILKRKDGIKADVLWFTFGALRYSATIR
jgi:hypothetical protein